MSSFFQQLYDAEINFEVSCFWDDGFHVRLGDRMNGYRAEDHVANWQEVEVWFRENAFKEFPRPEPAEGRGELVRDLINEIDVGKPPDDIGLDARANALLERILTSCCLCVGNRSANASSASS